MTRAAIDIAHGELMAALDAALSDSPGNWDIWRIIIKALKRKYDAARLEAGGDPDAATCQKRRPNLTN